MQLLLSALETHPMSKYLVGHLATQLLEAWALKQAGGDQFHLKINTTFLDCCEDDRLSEKYKSVVLSFSDERKMMVWFEARRKMSMHSLKTLSARVVDTNLTCLLDVRRLKKPRTLLQDLKAAHKDFWRIRVIRKPLKKRKIFARTLPVSYQSHEPRAATPTLLTKQAERAMSDPSGYELAPNQPSTSHHCSRDQLQATSDRSYVRRTHELLRAWRPASHTHTPSLRLRATPSMTSSQSRSQPIAQATSTNLEGPVTGYKLQEPRATPGVDSSQSRSHPITQDTSYFEHGDQPVTFNPTTLKGSAMSYELIMSHSERDIQPVTITPTPPSRI